MTDNSSLKWTMQTEYTSMRQILEIEPPGLNDEFGCKREEGD